MDSSATGDHSGSKTSNAADIVEINKSFHWPRISAFVVFLWATPIIAYAAVGATQLAALWTRAWTGEISHLRAADLTIKMLIFLAIPFTIFEIGMFIIRIRTIRPTIPGFCLGYLAYCTQICGLIGIFLWAEIRKDPSLLAFILGSGVGLAGFSLVSAGSVLWAMARQYALRSADDVLQRNQRPPILSLRTFTSDDESAPENYRQEARRTFRLFNPAFWTEQREWTFEELILCKALTVANPVVGIGRPAEPLPRLGAARKYVPDSSWQVEVGGLMDRCICAFVIVGCTAGLVWEFCELYRRSYLYKSIIILPQKSDKTDLWKAFVDSVAQIVPDHPLPVSLVEGALAIAFPVGRPPIIYKGPTKVAVYREILNSVVAAMK
jgi:hypothetical protein